MTHNDGLPTMQPTIQETQQEKPSKLKRLHIQPRDLDILESLSLAGLLTSHAIEWIHYPAWRENYQRYIKARTPNSPAYKPTANLHTRLRRFIENHFIQRVGRTAYQSHIMHERVPPVYVLTEQGAELLYTRRGINRNNIWFDATKLMLHETLEHDIVVGRFYAALRAELEYNGVSPVGHWCNNTFLTSDRNSFDETAKANAPQIQAQRPSATFVLQDEYYVVEIDYGATSVSSLRDKAKSYTSYLEHFFPHTHRYTGDFTVLMVTPSQRRILRIAEEITKLEGDRIGNYRFCTHDDIHPTTIQRAWQKVSNLKEDAELSERKNVEQPSIEFNYVPLWPVKNRRGA